MRLFTKYFLDETESDVVNQQHASNTPLMRRISSIIDKQMGCVKQVSPKKTEEVKRRPDAVKVRISQRNSCREPNAANRGRIKKTFSKCQNTIAALSKGLPEAAEYAMIRCGVDPANIQKPEHVKVVVDAIKKAPRKHEKLIGLFHGSAAVRAAFDNDSLAQNIVDARQETDGFLLENPVIKAN